MDAYMLAAIATRLVADISFAIEQAIRQQRATQAEDLVQVIREALATAEATWIAEAKQQAMEEFDKR